MHVKNDLLRLKGVEQAAVTPPPPLWIINDNNISLSEVRNLMTKDTIQRFPLQMSCYTSL